MTSASMLCVYVGWCLSHTIWSGHWGLLWCLEASPAPSTALDTLGVLVVIVNEWSAKGTHTKMSPHLNILYKHGIQTLTVRGYLSKNLQNHHHRVSVEQFLEEESTLGIINSSRWDQEEWFAREHLHCRALRALSGEAIEHLLCARHCHVFSLPNKLASFLSFFSERRKK